MALTQAEFDRIMGKQTAMDRAVQANQPTISAQRRSFFDSINNAAQAQLENLGMNRYGARDLTQKVLGSDNQMGIADFTPYGMGKGIEYAGREFLAPAIQDISRGNIANAIGGAGLGLGSVALATGRVPAPVRNVATAGARAVAEQIKDRKGVFGKLTIDPNMYAVPKVAGVPVNEILYPEKSLSQLTSAEKSAVTKFTKSLGNPSFRLREELKLTGGGNEIVPNLEMVTPTGINPEQVLNKVLTPVAGDQSATGGLAKKIAGIPLERPVPQQGGRMYPFIKDVNEENLGWASMEDAATSKQNNFIANENKFDGKDVLGVFQSMGNEGINFSHHQAPTMVAQLSVLKPPKEAIKMFDADMRAKTFTNKKTGKVTQPFKNFSGILSPDIYDQMLYGSNKGEFTAGNLNKTIAELMAQDKYQKIGFPSYIDTNKAMSESGLYTGASGKTIFQADTSRGLVNPLFDHGSYNMGIPRKEGGLLGGFMNAEGEIVSVPDEIVFRKTFEELRKEGKRDDRIRRSMMMSHRGEVADEQTVEGIMKYLGYLPK